MRRWIIAVAISCGASDTQMTAQFAPEMQTAPRATVSVLGVLKRGRMTSDAWLDLSPEISAALGGSSCAAAFDDKLDSSVASAFDKTARENGVTEALFDAFGPATDADLVVLIETSGQLPISTSKDGGPPEAVTRSSSSGTGMRGGSGRGMGGGMGSTGGMNLHQNGPPPSEDNGTADALEMSASIYSVRLKRSVGSVAMKYTGASAKDALHKFSQKLAESLQGTHCIGWKSDAWPSPESIRALR